MKKSIAATLLCVITVLTGCSGPHAQTSASNAPASQPQGSDIMDTSANASYGSAEAGTAEAGTAEAGAAEASAPADSQVLTCRIISGADSGQLVLAKSGGDSYDVYTLHTGTQTVLRQDGGEDTAFEDGMLVEIHNTDGIQETYPAQIGGGSITILPEKDNMCAMYLEVLEDLWETDEGLNSGITELGVDLSNTRLSPSEQAAVAYVFGMRHGLLPIQGTFEELKELGYFTDSDSHPYWEDGCLFSIEETTSEDGKVTFNAQKWRSGLGAYYFFGCTSNRSEKGVWSAYETDSQAIS